MANYQYKGIDYSVPNNDDGEWRYVVHLDGAAARKAGPQTGARKIYASRDLAMAAAQQEIDALLKR